MVLLDALFSYDKAFYVWKTSMHLALEQQVLPYTSMYLMPMFWHAKWTAISKHCEAMELKRYDWESILMSSTLEHKRHPIAQGSRHSRKSCHLQSKTNWDQSFCTCITVLGQTLPHNCQNVHWYSHIPSKKSGLHGCMSSSSINWVHCLNLVHVHCTFYPGRQRQAQQPDLIYCACF